VRQRQANCSEFGIEVLHLQHLLRGIVHVAPELGHVLGTQCLLPRKPKTLAIEVSGRLAAGVSAKDLILTIIGASGGIGSVIEYRGSGARALAHWRAPPTDAGVQFDHEVRLDGNRIEPMITFGTHPGMVVPVSGNIPVIHDDPVFDQTLADMGLRGASSPAECRCRSWSIQREHQQPQFRRSPGFRSAHAADESAHRCGLRGARSRYRSARTVERLRRG
jgi:Aconitase family (aconitate hydratase)